MSLLLRDHHQRGSQIRQTAAQQHAQAVARESNVPLIKKGLDLKA